MGNSLSHRSAIPEDEVVTAEHYQGCVVSKHQGFRSYQEDDFDVAEFPLRFASEDATAQLFCVLDGHGGSGAVAHCKKFLLTNIRQCLQFELEDTGFFECIRKTFIKTEADLTRSYTNNSSGGSSPLVNITAPEPAPLTSETVLKPPLKLTFRIPETPRIWENDDGSGCCALVCMKWHTSILVANAGDCRALMIFKDKTFRTLLNEHRPALEGESERIRAAGLHIQAGRVNGELAVSRSIGDFRYKGTPVDPEEHAVTCVPTLVLMKIDDTMDKLILMTDGIYDGISMEDLVEKFSSPLPLEDQIKGIVTHCIQPGRSSDNMTVMVIPI